MDVIVNSPMKILPAIFLVIISLQAFAQTEKKALTDECDITLADRSVFKNVRFALVDSMIYLEKDNVSRTYPTKDVMKIVFKGGGFWGGFIGGAAFTTGVFVIIALINSKDAQSHFGYTLLLGLGASIPVGLLTGLAAELFSHDTSYNLSTENIPAKLKKLKMIYEQRKEK